MVLLVGEMGTKWTSPQAIDDFFAYTEQGCRGRPSAREIMIRKPYYPLPRYTHQLACPIPPFFFFSRTLIGQKDLQ